MRRTKRYSGPGRPSKPDAERRVPMNITVSPEDAEIIRRLMDERGLSRSGVIGLALDSLRHQRGA